MGVPQPIYYSTKEFKTTSLATPRGRRPPEFVLTTTGSSAMSWPLGYDIEVISILINAPNASPRNGFAMIQTFCNDIGF